MPFNNRIIGHLGNLRDSRDAIGRKQPDAKSGMQGDSFQIQLQRFAIHLKRVDAIDIRRKIIRLIAFRIAAEIADIELGVAVQNGLELANQLGAIGQPPVFRHIAEIQVTPGPRIILGMRRLKKRHHGALRRIAIQRVFVLRWAGWLGRW